ncbi:MAG: sensor histidine kinase [bacterium]|nr:sensor histidine kinase [bacterium]
MPLPNATATEKNQLQVVMNYAAELELEVDRLRRRDQYLQQEALDHNCKTASLCRQAAQLNHEDEALRSVLEACSGFDKLLRDLHEPPGYHPSFDQVIAIALRPLAEQVFRWQQRLSGASNAILRLDLQPDSITWFPARLRHILDNLISNALRYRDPEKGEIRVGLQLRIVNYHYELRFTDNGLGIPDDKLAGMLELFYRAAPSRSAGLGVGLAVVKLLVEHSCGTLSVSSGKGQGTSVTVILPRYDLDDHIE